MWALYLAAGLVCGAGLTYIILYLLTLQGKERAAAPALPYADDYQETEEEEETGFAALGIEEELSQAEIAEFTAEDAKAAAETETAGSLAMQDETAAETGVVLFDAEAAAEALEAERERKAFIKAKKEGGKAVVPALRFTLSRQDVIDFITDMRESLSMDEAKPVLPSVVFKKRKHFCDSMHCGEWCFGLMYEKENVIKFTLRLGEKQAGEISANHTAFRTALFPKGENWYDLIVDQSFSSKAEVYKILEASFAFVLGLYYRKELERYLTDTAAARADTLRIARGVPAASETADPLYETAIAEYRVALEKFRLKNKLNFNMTRKRIVYWARRNLSECGEILERSRRDMPASLNLCGKTYALIYEKIYRESGSPDPKLYVSATVRISDPYAQWLALRHPGVRRAHFPKNRNWYVVPIDASFKNAQMVYRVLKHARNFVCKTKASPLCAQKTNCKGFCGVK